ncbi:MAG: glycosyltransferase family A protein, partial [Sedimentisphaerales bacterium]
MDKVSILIPARNEIYLSKTIENILSNARGDIEIIVVCDGYQPEPSLPDDDRIIEIRNCRAKGQRQAINEAARVASGKYILKLDAHCAVDEGFDVKLAACCEYDWTVIPRLYQLDAEKWEPKWRKKTDFMFFRSPDAKEHPFRIDYYDARTAKEFREEYRAYKEAEWRKGDICDTMASLGAAWFMHRERFWELGGMDEGHGHWGQMGVELACKTWLSGGRQVVNKKTWFAHLWRAHAPWKLTQRQVDKAREYSKNLWMNDKWPLQKRQLSWLIEKFSPVPTWDGKFEKRVSDLTLLYYTSNRINKTFRDKVLDQLKFTCNAPIVSVSQKPMALGKNICIGEIGASLQNIYNQVLVGLREVKTEYVALVEDDCLYVPEHFNYRPKDCFAYNLNRWLLHADRDEVYSYRRRPILSQCIAPTKILLDCLSQREGRNISKKHSGEPGLFEKKLGLKEYPYETFETKEPNVVVCHNKNTSGRKTWGKDAEPRTELAP